MIDGIVARLEVIGHVEAERGAAAGVFAHQIAVDPYAGLPVARADVQPHAAPISSLPVFGRCGDTRRS